MSYKGVGIRRGGKWLCAWQASFSTTVLLREAIGIEIEVVAGFVKKVKVLYVIKTNRL